MNFVAPLRTFALLALVFAVFVFVTVKYLLPVLNFQTVSKSIELILLGMGLFSIVLLAEQLRLTENRAKRVAYHEYFDSW